MEEVESLPKLVETSERLRKVLTYRRDELLSLSFYMFFQELRNLITANPRIKFSDLVFEILLRLTQGLYLKSSLLLNPNAPKEELEESHEMPLSQRQFYLYDCLPLDRVLGEWVFVTKVFLDDLLESPPSRGDLTKITRAILEVLERLRAEPRMVLELNQQSISKVAEELKEFILEKKATTWREMIKERELFSRESLVFAFLAILFLVFEGFCGAHQDAENCIHIYLR